MSKLLVNLRWPPPDLGLEAPFASALLARRKPGDFWQVVWQSSVLGCLIAVAMVLTDQLLFAGISLTRVRAAGEFSLWIRLLVVVYAAVTEELIYRFGLMTLVAWVSLRALAWIGIASRSTAIWLGIVAAAILFGLAHVANIPDAPHPVARAVVLNGMAGVALGWWYSLHGIEAAMLGHLAAGSFLYLGLAGLL